MTLKRAIATKLLWIIASFVVFYFIGSALGFVPQSVTDGVSWLANNFTNFTIIFVAIVALIIVRMITKWRKKT